jgi:hypothetical protein
VNLVSEDGEPLCLASDAMIELRQFDYGIFSARAQFLGTFSRFGLVPSPDVAALKQAGLVHSKSGTIFNYPGLCESAFAWDIWQEIELISRYAERGLRVLDVGCGWGRLIPAMLEKNIEIDALECNSFLAAHCAERFGSRANIFNVDAAEFCAPGRYGLAFAAMNTLRYLGTWARLVLHLRHLSDSLAVNGSYLIHASFTGRDGRIEPTAWQFSHFGRPFRIEWSTAGMDYLNEVCIEEVVLDDLTTGARHREFQSQLVFSPERFMWAVDRCQKLHVAEVFSETGLCCGVGKDAVKEGRIWVRLVRV